MNINTINSVFWIRAIACIAVVMGHSIQLTNVEFKNFSNDFYSLLLNYLLAAGLFGTPVFVFISELLLSKKYPTQLPVGFFKKRIAYIFFPYLFMNVVYAFIKIESYNVIVIIVEILKNIFLGHSVLYFILIIFQFYLLHSILNNFLNRYSPVAVLSVSFAINMLYLAIFNFMDPPNNSIAKEVWRYGYWLPFVGWLFYFTLGFYCGKYFDKFVYLLGKYSKTVFALPPLTFFLFIIINKFDLINYTTSKRVDMVPYTVSIIFLIFLVSTHFIKTVPKIVMIISNYSFSIYLLHMLIIHLIELFTPPIMLNKLSYLVIVMVISVCFSILLSYLINKFTFGKYIVGNINTYKSYTAKHKFKSPRSIKV
ncbi:acyltransferase family protein [Bacillus sp. ISL-35]|uniref:acyltransferase family protein n=1 Tax=Bacillus sp. ISL-35 TaxID=2819122 RepID=UPI001BED0937|nr:acyltransferase family protein [Bacillus sp. ISL-35]MBT2679814.1 acyltransferase family protein [Bacillus sp. ISL-35]MBT2704849.1 acyltransferase family protein [Chryseobacterium sp. ISL-80]